MYFFLVMKQSVQGNVQILGKFCGFLETAETERRGVTQRNSPGRTLSSCPEYADMVKS
jgi:hypothetical protein